MKRPLFALLLALSTTTAALASGPATVTAAAGPSTAGPAPSVYLPAPQELPPGFEERPGSMTSDVGEGLRTEYRQYYRPGAETGLVVGVGAADGEERAWAYHHDLVRRFRDKGFAAAPVEGLGDEATSLLKKDGELDQGMIIFRVGATVALLCWIDEPGALTDQEIGRQLGGVAGPMLRRMRDAA